MCIFTGNAGWSFWGAINFPFFVRLPVTNAWNCHSMYTAFSSNVGAWGMWACSLFLSFILYFWLYYTGSTDSDVSVTSRQRYPSSGSLGRPCPSLEGTTEVAVPDSMVMEGYALTEGQHPWQCSLLSTCTNSWPVNCLLLRLFHHLSGFATIHP